MKILIDVKTKNGRPGGPPREPHLRTDRTRILERVRSALNAEENRAGSRMVIATLTELKRNPMSDKNMEDGMAILAKEFGVHFFWSPAKEATETRAPEPEGWEVSGTSIDTIYASLSEAVEAAFTAIIDHNKKVAQEHHTRASELRRKVRQAQDIAEQLGILQEDEEDDEDDED